MWMGLGIKITGWIRKLGTAGPFGDHATLTDGLVSYWTLDEAGGVRYDSVVASANDLTDNNTVGSATGKNNLAANFVAANGESLSSTAGALALGDTNWTVAGWAYRNALGVDTVVSRGNATPQCILQIGRASCRER